MTTQISVETLSPITHNQIPVITTELLAHLYGTKIKNISDNFLNNTTRFVVGKHFFKIEKNELREFKNRPETIGLVGKNARSLILWTERALPATPRCSKQIRLGRCSKNWRIAISVRHYHRQHARFSLPSTCLTSTF